MAAPSAPLPAATRRQPMAAPGRVTSHAQHAPVLKAQRPPPQNPPPPNPKGARRRRAELGALRLYWARPAPLQTLQTVQNNDRNRNGTNQQRHRSDCTRGGESRASPGSGAAPRDLEGPPLPGGWMGNSHPKPPGKAAGIPQGSSSKPALRASSFFPAAPTSPGCTVSAAFPWQWLRRGARCAGTRRLSTRAKQQLGTEASGRSGYLLCSCSENPSDKRLPVLTL